jgi:hypothetical protein
MSARMRIGLAVVVLVGLVAAGTFAEDIALTTYYPSPRGVYNELRTMGETLLAQQTGNVGIGTSTPAEKLEVNGGVRLNPETAMGTKPACTPARRGTVWFIRDAQVEGGMVDQLEFCASVYGHPRWVVVSGMLAQ